MKNEASHAGRIRQAARQFNDPFPGAVNEKPQVFGDID
jgi:hypothetical protein